MKTAWFSILSPQYHIPAHRGVTKGLVRIHLGLRVPADRENCFIRVGDKVRRWKEGKCFIIDDTYDHEVFNNTDEERTALVLDVERPLKWRGKIFSELFLWAICKTAYVQDGLKNLEKWEKRIDSTSPNAETL
jgi:beta-hydroxylase